MLKKSQEQESLILRSLKKPKVVSLALEERKKLVLALKHFCVLCSYME